VQMSKLIAILLSWIIMLQSMNLNLVDVLNINELIEHAQEHKEEFGDNFFQFLAKHYGADKAQHAHHDSHKTSHDNLPFQHTCHLSLVFVIDLNTTYFSDLKEFSTTGQSANFYYKSPSSNLFVSGIFQPPRIA
jgi:hypothetical protein